MPGQSTKVSCMPFAIEMPPPPVIVLGVVLGSMIVGLILDRIQND